MKTRFAAVALVALLALTGCSETSESAPTDAPSESAAPLTAEAAPSEPAGTDEAYLADVRVALEANGGSSIPNATDDQLLAAGVDACEQMRAGADASDVRVIDGEQPTETGYTDSIRIAGAASKHLCEDMDAS